MAHGKMKGAPIFEKKATVCKYLVPEGYPGKPVTDQMLQVDGAALEKTGARVFYASVYEKAGAIYTQSSRSIGLVGVADTIEEAEKTAESACSAITGRVWHRKDIGTRGLLQRRITHMKEIGAL
jgi:phosphoribosylamine--glycine ligase